MPELLTRGDGLLKPAEVTGFKSEWWPTSNRNAVRLRVVTPGRNKSEFAVCRPKPLSDRPAVLAPRRRSCDRDQILAHWRRSNVPPTYQRPDARHPPKDSNRWKPHRRQPAPAWNPGRFRRASQYELQTDFGND